MAKIISDEFIRELQHIVGKKHVSASAIDTEVYSYDASSARGKSGAVVFPANSRELARVVKAACRYSVPFIPRGFGTNLSGGTVASSGGVVICLSRLNRVLKLSPERRQAVVQPGVTNLELQDALGSMGLFFAPDPASQKVATLGGNVGENSGGPHCLKYGVTTNHILGLEAVLPDGEVVRFGGPALDPPGFDLRGVMVGSEGTLGVITEITVQVLPKPETVITMLAVYDAASDAARSVSDIVAAGIIPATLEMMDSLVIQAVEDSFACGYPRDAAAVLIIEVEGPLAGLDEQAEHIQALCLKNRCRRIHRAADDQERDRLWEGRRGAFGAIARLAPNFVLNDCTVPRTKLPEALARIDAIAGSHQLRHGNVFHAGDGNLHPLIFYDSRKTGQSEKAHRAAWEIMEACVELGGTISGEHGIGLEKLEAMRLIFSEHDLKFQRALKNAFDPHGLLNPGKVVPAPQEESTEPRAEKNRSAVNTREALGEIVEAVKQAVVEKQALSPIGNGTWHEYGNQCVGKPVPLKTSRLSHIVEFDHANQVVTAGAGVSLINIQERLRPHNQWLPIRPLPFLQSHSLGGMVATGACGPERAFYGAPRDLLLGLQLVDPHGRLVSTGGKVIKNVAGYD
ncbi:MAG: FAD-binding protein, partial [Deltaproteobacteria bacterium]|nr:FAD-binding protein [Deltaproteobacteria bacterium]